MQRNIKSVQNLTHFLKRNIFFQVIFAILLGQRLGALKNNPIPPIAERLMLATENLFEVSHEAMYGLPLWKYFPTKSYQKLAECEDTIYE